MKKLIILMLCVFLIGCDNSVNTGNENLLDNEASGEELLNDSSDIDEVAVDEDAVITIKDSGLEFVIREAIGKPEGVLLQSDMNQIENLRFRNDEIKVYELDGLEYAYNLRNVSYLDGTLKSLSPIKDCKKLYALTVSYSVIEDTIEMFNNPILETVNFVDVPGIDGAFLLNSKMMIDLGINKGNVDNLDFIKNMALLESISIENSGLNSIGALQDNKQIKDLNFQLNNVADISPLEGCDALESINLSYNKVVDIGPLMGLENLRSLRIYEEIINPLIDREKIKMLINQGISVQYHE